MQIYLVRHTETVAEPGVCYGQTDLALKEPFHNEFNAIVKELNIQNPLIFSSPLIRCKLLANHIAEQTGSKQEVCCIDQLQELNFGTWEMQKWDDIDPLQLNAWGNDFVFSCVPNGESFLQLYRRVSQFINHTLSQKHGSTRPVVIVTHAGVIRCFHAYFNHIPLINVFNFKPNYGTIHPYTIKKSDYKKVAV